MNLDSQRVTLLVLLDLSGAFDIVDHGVLLNRLSTSFGVWGSALQWFTSYLLNRSPRVSFDQNLSQKFNLQCGVPQGSCLGPLLFTIYASKLFEVIKNYLPQSHAYADDTQLYLSFNADSACSQNDAVEAMEQCIEAIRSWMIKDKLLLNDNMTEFMIIGTSIQYTTRIITLVTTLSRAYTTLMEKDNTNLSGSLRKRTIYPLFLSSFNRYP